MAAQTAYKDFARAWSYALRPEGKGKNSGLTYDSWDSVSVDETQKSFVVNFFSLDWWDPIHMPWSGSGWIVTSAPAVPYSPTVNVTEASTITVPGSYNITVSVSYHKNLIKWLWFVIQKIFILIIRIILGGGLAAILCACVAAIVWYFPWSRASGLLLAMVSMLRDVVIQIVAKPAPSSSGAPVGDRVN